tara:strand:+ start:484 stop:690 length:207 start_codon:yes stop_codon:yes gene_type:complete
MENGVKNDLNMSDFAHKLFGHTEDNQALNKSEATAECKRFAKTIEQKFGVVVFFDVYTQKEIEEQKGE